MTDTERTPYDFSSIDFEKISFNPFVRELIVTFHEFPCVSLLRSLARIRDNGLSVVADMVTCRCVDMCENDCANQ